jgi:uncharacterized phiE125 gp8 family phage protein
MTLISTDPPLAEPVTLAELKAHLRIDADDENDLLEGLVRVARAHLEAVTGVALISQGYRLALDDWPSEGVIQLLRTPVQTIDAILLYDADGVEQTLDLSGCCSTAARIRRGWRCGSDRVPARRSTASRSSSRPVSARAPRCRRNSSAQC